MISNIFGQLWASNFVLRAGFHKKVILPWDRSASSLRVVPKLMSRSFEGNFWSLVVNSEQKLRYEIGISVLFAINAHNMRTNFTTVYYTTTQSNEFV